MLSAAEEATRQSLSPLVAVRRLWPGPRWMPNYEPGALVHLPPADAQGLIAAGDAFRILPPPQPDNTAKPLHLLIRDRLGTDPELAGLTTTARRYASRGLPHCPEAPARLRLMLPPMPIRLVPATFVINGEAPAAGWYAESYLPQVRDAGDRKLALLAFRIRRVRIAIIAAVVDDLRKGVRPARGLLPNGERIDVPPEIWSAASVILDLGGGIVTTGQATMFVTVTVEPPPPVKPQLPCSPAAIRMFTAAFSTEMLALGRLFVIPEATEAARLEYGNGLSAARIADAVRELRPSSWHRRGRRCRDVMPSPIEMAAAARAARQAVEAKAA